MFKHKKWDEQEDSIGSLLKRYCFVKDQLKFLFQKYSHHYGSSTQDESGTKKKKIFSGVKILKS